IASGTGAIFHGDGATFTKQTTGTTAILNQVWGLGSNERFAVASDGILLHSMNRGMSWTLEASGTTKYLSGIWGIAGSSMNLFIAVGESGVIRVSTDGSSWFAGGSGTTEWLTDIWGSGNLDTGIGEIYITGLNGVLLHST